MIGREDGLAVRIDRPGVSRRHACIRVEDEVRLGLRARVVLERSGGEDTETESS